MLLDQSSDYPQFGRLKTIRREPARRQPKLALSIVPLNVNVWRFIGIAGEEKEPLGA